MSAATNPSRRDVLTGKLGHSEGRITHISSAVVRAVPSHLSRLLPELAAMHGVEVAAVEQNKIVLVMEAGSPGELGATLTRINLMDGVLAASMVFEHAAAEEELRHDDRGQPS